MTLQREPTDKQPLHGRLWSRSLGTNWEAGARSSQLRSGQHNQPALLDLHRPLPTPSYASSRRVSPTAQGTVAQPLPSSKYPASLSPPVDDGVSHDVLAQRGAVNADTPRRRGHGRQPDQDRGFIALRLVSNRPRHSPLAVRLWALKQTRRPRTRARARAHGEHTTSRTDWLELSSYW